MFGLMVNQVLNPSKIVSLLLDELYKVLMNVFFGLSVLFLHIRMLFVFLVKYYLKDILMLLKLFHQQDIEDFLRSPVYSQEICLV
jgi:hypothetical protein